MSAYIDCGICRARLICSGDEASTDARFTAWANAQGWVVGQNRCPDHAGDAGLALVAAAVTSLSACTADHDPEPWSVYAGIASGGGGVYNGGGPSAGPPSRPARTSAARSRTIGAPSPPNLLPRMPSA